MIKKILLVLGIGFLLFVLWAAYGIFIADPVSPTATATYNEEGLEITIDYSQPLLNRSRKYGTKCPSQASVLCTVCNRYRWRKPIP